MEIERLDRRRFLIRLGGASAAITVLGAGLDIAAGASRSGGSVAGLSGRPPGPGGALGPRAGESASRLGEREFVGDGSFAPAPGTRPEITAVPDHYLIDINPRPPAVDVDGWRLPITGLVENPAELTLDQIRTDYAPIERYITLSCISNRVGGDLIGTTKWTGARLKDVLAGVGTLADATHIEIRSVDGYHETVDLDLILAEPRIMLAYAWNDQPLTRAHGAPLRIWIPDRYGMKQPRWISAIEVTAEDRPGYWVERGWDEKAIVKTTSVIDTVAAPITGAAGEQLVPVGGIAYSGDRGISRVEVRVDGGEWSSTQLAKPLSDTTWAVWRFDWLFAEGEHTFEVRCAEADGTNQIEAEADNRPSGATGIHSVRERA